MPYPKLPILKGPALNGPAQEVAQRLEEGRAPIVTPYQLFQILCQIDRNCGEVQSEPAPPDLADLKKIATDLLRANKLAQDRDYGRRAYRILSNGDSDAEDICCIVDPFCHISHLSALQRYSFTDRRPVALHLTAPDLDAARELIQASVMRDYGAQAEIQDAATLPKPVHVKHPDRARKRKLRVLTTRHPGISQPLRGSFARIATIGQTFADTLTEPALCGGMPHILDIWREHAPLFLEEIVATIEHTRRDISKVRAGYILDEILGIRDSRVDAWQRFAKRGGSQVLDPAKGFAPNYSEKWMLSVNV
jgi:predicted transcriptional regulator of viral defense system